MKLRKTPRAYGTRELALDLAEHFEPVKERPLPFAGKADELGAAVLRIIAPLDEPEPDHLFDQLKRRLLRNPESLGEIGEAHPFEVEVREKGRVRRTDPRLPRLFANAKDGPLVHEASRFEEKLRGAPFLLRLELGEIPRASHEDSQSRLTNWVNAT